MACQSNGTGNTAMCGATVLFQYLTLSASAKQKFNIYVVTCVCVCNCTGATVLLLYRKARPCPSQ